MNLHPQEVATKFLRTGYDKLSEREQQAADDESITARSFDIVVGPDLRVQSQ